MLDNPFHSSYPHEIEGFIGVYSTMANHSYTITDSNSGEILSHIQFQDGPLLDMNIRGVFNEDLLLIVRDRLQGFQTSEFSCRENDLALTKIEEALDVLFRRTRAREQRGVEGKAVA